MKRKFLSVLIALVLVLSFSLVTAVPASAAALTSVTATPTDTTAGATTTYTIAFTTAALLEVAAVTDQILITFPAGFDVSGATVNATTATQSGTDPTITDITGQVITLDVGADEAAGAQSIVLDVIVNNETAADTYVVSIETQDGEAGTIDGPTDSDTFTLFALPAITAVEPAEGNVGDTMWVEVTGTAFTGTAEACTTTFDFGTGISVVADSYKYIDVDEIDCQITITAAGAATVAATTTVGTGTTTGTFTANAADTAQVDVWVKYTPTGTTFDAATLDFDATTATITLGIAEATAGTEADPQVLIVHAATYTNDAASTLEGLMVDQDYVTIKSLSGAASTILSQSGANFGVTFEGKRPTIEDLTINRGGTLGGQSGVRLSQVDVDLVAETFTIKGCTFSDWDSTPVLEAVIGGNNYGRFTSSTITSATIEGNTFSGNSGPVIWLEAAGGTVDGLVIKDNQLLGDEGADERGIMLVGDIGDTTAAVVDNNTISDMGGDGISFWYEAGGDTGTATITGNNISGCTDGIDTTAAWNLTITENTIVNNSVTGIKIKDGVQGTIVIKYNDISGNTEYGLKNEDAGETVTATYNWWGKATGAYHATTNPGVSGYRGDAVSDLVDYAPWLYYTVADNDGDTLANIIASEVPAYANSVVLDVVGWNTFSVPIGLDGQYNNWDELITLSSANYSMAYYFDTATQTFQSLSTVNTYALAPGEGFYIKMNEAGSLPYCYSTVNSMPTRSLSADWNLIGGGMDGTMDEKDACISIVESGSTAGYSHIISPAENAGDPWVYIAGAGTSGDFVVGEGYWVFLPIARTLGLFDPTPDAWVALP